MKKSIKVLFCGDIMPGGVLPYQESYIEPELSKYLTSFDFRVGTLECAIGTNIPPASEKLIENGGNNNICFARDEDFFRLKEMGFNAFSLGNNHCFDLGEEGLKNTIRHLEDNGIGYFGAGMNKKEASLPYVVNIGRHEVAFIGCCIKGIAPKSIIAATANSYGTYQPSIDELLEQIKSLKGKYDNIIIMPHWGEEHVFFPPIQCIEYAKRIIDAGADAVFGTHSHCISSFSQYKKKPIFYGMGNFLYPDFCLKPPRPFYYPRTTEELINMPKCINYPKSVANPIVCVWGKDSRIGMAVEALIDDPITARTRFVKMDSNNILCFYRSYSKVKDYLLSFLVSPILNTITRMPFYDIFYKLAFRVSRSITYRFSDFRKDV